MNQSQNQNKMKTFYRAHIPEVFGYGLTCFSETPEDAMKLLEETYIEWCNNRDLELNFNERFEYYGGDVRKIELNKSYYDL